MAKQGEDEGGSTITRNLRVTEGLAAGLTVLGLLLNAVGSISGFYVWLVADALWLYVGHRRRMPALMVMYTVLAAGAVVGIVCWRMKGI